MKSELADYASRLRALGRKAMASVDGEQAWVPGASVELVRLPFECREPVDNRFLERLLGQRGIWVASYLLGDPHEPNCLHYVCKDGDYDCAKLRKNARRDIRRGLRSFRVEPCSWDALLRFGFRAQADTAERHNNRRGSRALFEKQLHLYGAIPQYMPWGVWDSEGLAAWLVALVIDDWALIQVARARTDALPRCPNNALLYAVTRHFLRDRRLSYVTQGLSSLQSGGTEKGLHRFKVRMGYQPVPVHRRFALSPALSVVVRPRVLSWGWDRLSQGLPREERLRKLAGLSRLVSGRETAPLASFVDAEAT